MELHNLQDRSPCHLLKLMLENKRKKLLKITFQIIKLYIHLTHVPFEVSSYSSAQAQSGVHSSTQIVEISE